MWECGEEAAEREREEKNACGGARNRVHRYALDHKYPNEMWVYAPAGRGHTHTYGGRACRPSRSSFFSVDVAVCILRRASCFGAVPSWEVVCAGRGEGGKITRRVDGRILPVL